MLEKKEDLSVPKTSEKRIREEFYKDLKRKGKIDHYEVKIAPLLFKLQNKKSSNLEQQYGQFLHPKTIKLIETQGIDSSPSLISSRNNHVHSIVDVNVDHFSFDEQNQFLIVKTIEEMATEEGKHVVIQTIRIYKEVLLESQLKQNFSKKFKFKHGK